METSTRFMKYESRAIKQNPDLWEEDNILKPGHFVFTNPIKSKPNEQRTFWGWSKNRKSIYLFFSLKKPVNDNYPKSIQSFFIFLKQSTSSSHTSTGNWSGLDPDTTIALIYPKYLKWNCYNSFKTSHHCYHWELTFHWAGKK